MVPPAWHLSPSAPLAWLLAHVVAPCGAHLAGTAGYKFDYAHHGEEWLVGECGSRERQSPIDFGSSAPWYCNATSSAGCFKGPFFVDYEAVAEGFAVRNDGRSLSVDLAGRGYGGITYNGDWFEISSVSFHAASEHTLGGRRLPLELHVNHKQYDSDHVLVVAVLFDVPGVEAVPLGAAALPQVTGSHALQFLRGGGGRGGGLGGARRALGRRRGVARTQAPSGTAAAAPPPGDSAAGFSRVLAGLLSDPLPRGGGELHVPLAVPTDLVSPLVAGGVFFEYDGSLTTPPCSEQVTWLVRRDPLTASGAQADAVQAAISAANSGLGNWRGSMPLMGRPVFVRSAERGSPAPPSDSPPAPSQGLPVAVEPRGNAVAREAIEWASEATRLAGRLGSISGPSAGLDMAAASAAGDLGLAAASAPAPAPRSALLTLPS